MRNSKKLPRKQLEKFSNVFAQLGLVLVLFVVYVTLEYETEEKKIEIPTYEVADRVFLQDQQDVVFRKEPEKVKPKVELPKAQTPIIDEIIKGDDDVEETVLQPLKKKPVFLDPNTLVTVDEPKAPIEDDPKIPFLLIEDAPIFSGCEGLSKKENKVCFEEKMRKFIQKNFDGQLAQELGLSSGKKRISTQFVIDKNGKIIDVEVRAPHPKLQEEAQRIIDKLPKFTPGKQRGVPVKVRYTLPITFQVE